MDSPVAVAKFLLPKVPFFLRTATSHTFGLSETSQTWDLRSELIIKTIRLVLDGSKPSTISKQQRLSTKDPGIKGKTWVSKVTLPAPPDPELLSTLERAITNLHPGPSDDGPPKYTRPTIAPVTAEWTGHRPTAKSSSTPRPDLPEAEHYTRLMADTTAQTTILYMHGGALYLMDPASHRGVCTQLAQATGGRCLSVRYRLAPQNAFPSAPLDCLVAYLSLLAPPPGAYHAAVPADKIVFAGDSAGGNLSLVLLQLLLEMRRANGGAVPTVRFHGREVKVPLPAGVAVSSPWCDMTACMPSIRGNLKYDFLPSLEPERLLRIPPCEVWPAEPPRGDLICEVEALCHPLLSPLGARDWTGAPPVQVHFGTEILADEARATAGKMEGQGVKVEAFHWEYMPHTFSQVLVGTEASRKMFEKWGAFIKKVAEGGEISSSLTMVRAKSLQEEVQDVGELRRFSDEQIEKMMVESQQKRMALGIGGAEALNPKL